MAPSVEAAVSTETAPSGAPEKVEVSTSGTQTCAIERLVPETFYAKMRPLTIFSKFFGTFPLSNICQRDGRKLSHSWMCPWQLYDMILCGVVICCFFYSTNKLLDGIQDEEEKYMLTIWLGVTFWSSAARAVITFFVSHFYAHKYPEVFHAMEEYHLGIGSYIIKRRRGATFQKVGPIIASICMLLLLQVTSVMFFMQFTDSENTNTAYFAAFSFMFMYMWKELPINLFIVLLLHLTYRFDEIREQIKEVRVRDDKDSSCDLESNRLRYAALVNVLNLLQKCYGLQLAVNIVFLIVETIMQLFIFIVISKSKNVFLLDLSIYNFCVAGLFIFFVDRIERKGDHVLEELSSIDLNSKSKLQQYQVQLFVSQVQARPVQISASGFCTINNSLIGSLFSAIATYLIVLIQFEPYVMQITNSTLEDPSHRIIQHNGYVYKRIG